MGRNAKPVTDADRFEQVIELATAPMTYHDVQYTLNLSLAERKKLDSVLNKDLAADGKRHHLISGDKPKLVWGCDAIGLPDQPVPAWAIPLINAKRMQPTTVPVPNFETIVNDVEISQQWDFIKERAREIDDKIVEKQTLGSMSALISEFVNGRGGSRETLRMTLGATLELVGHVLALQSSNRSLKAMAPMQERYMKQAEEKHTLELENQRLRLTQEPPAENRLRLAQET